MFSLGLSNAYIITGEKAVMVDTGMTTTKEKLADMCHSCGIEPEMIELLIITHEHVDHFYHAAWIREMTGAKVVCHYEAAETLIKGLSPVVIPRSMTGIRAYAEARIHPPCRDVPAVVPDILIRDVWDLKPYGIEGKIVPVPGHSRGSVAVVMDNGGAIVGDTFLKSHFSDELEIAFFAEVPEKLDDSIRFLIESSDIFYSGHGGPYTKTQVMEACRKDPFIEIRA